MYFLVIGGKTYLENYKKPYSSEPNHNIFGARGPHINNCPTPAFGLSFFFWGGAGPVAYGGSQARGLIGAVNAILCQSHSNAKSEPHLQPTPQLAAMQDP